MIKTSLPTPLEGVPSGLPPHTVPRIDGHPGSVPCQGQERIPCEGAPNRFSCERCHSFFEYVNGAWKPYNYSPAPAAQKILDAERAHVRKLQRLLNALVCEMAPIEKSPGVYTATAATLPGLPWARGSVGNMLLGAIEANGGSRQEALETAFANLGEG